MHTRKNLVTAGLAVLVCIGLTGCEGTYPQPSEDAVYYFLANARLRGRMRVCWPEGQAYVVTVTKADAALQSELTALRGLLTFEAWWDRDDPRWEDTEKVKEHAEELTKLANEGAMKRAECLEKLHAALDKLPAGLSWADDAARAAFKERLWTALGCEGAPLENVVRRLEELLAARLRLFEKAAACAESRSKSARGMVYDDEACQKAMDELFAAYKGQATAEHERFFEWAARRMAENAPILKTIDKQKERECYNLLDNERTYIRNRLEAMQKELREMIKADGVELGRLEKADEPDSTKIEYFRNRIARLEAVMTSEFERFKRIMEPKLSAEAAPAP